MGQAKSIILVLTATISFVLGYLVSSALRPQARDSAPVPQADVFSSDVPIWNEGLKKMTGRWRAVDQSGETVLEADFHLLTIPSSQHWEELSGRTLYLGYPNQFIFGDFIYVLTVRSEDIVGGLPSDQGPFLSVGRESLRGPDRADSLVFVRETEIPISLRKLNAEHGSGLKGLQP